MHHPRTVGALMDEIREHHVEFDITAAEAERQEPPLTRWTR